MTANDVVMLPGFVPPRTKRGKPDLYEQLMELQPGDSLFVRCEPGKKWVHVQVCRFVGANGDNLRCKRGKHEGVDGVFVSNVKDD